MKQTTLATAGFERYGRTTRRAVFLAEMERVVPWPALCGLIEPVYPKAGNGRPPVGSSGCCASISCSNGSTCWTRRSTIRWQCAVSSASIFAASRCLTRRRCAASATCWKTHDLGQQLFDEVQRHLTAKGLKVATGIVDATIINAPSSTKNAAKARDPEMHHEEG
jgi:transposase, IS5 family